MPIVAVGLALAFSSGFAISAGFVGLGSFLFNVGIGLALSGALNFVTGLFQKQPTAITTRGRTVTARQAVAPWRIIYGEIRTGGILTFLDTRGTDNKYLDIVITLAGHQVQEIGTMYFDGVAVPLDSSGNGTGKYDGFVHVEKNLGTTTQAALAGLVLGNPKWTSSHRQRGRAHAWVQLTWSADVFPSGVPVITFDVKGALVYDPRTALTAWSDNNALCVRDYLTSSSYGLAAPSSEIDDTAFIAAANVCDEPVALRQGGTEKRYTCNGLLDSSVQFGNALKALFSACAGDLTYAGGLWALYPAAWRPPVALADGRSAYTEDDLRGPIEFAPRTPHRDIFNAVKGVYVSPEVNDQQADFPTVEDASYVTEDNGEKIYKDIELPFTNSSATAQRLGKIILRTARNQGRARFPMRLSGSQTMPPDVIRFTSSRFGWADKLFKVTDFTLVTYSADDGSPLIGVDLLCRETTADIYDWTAATDQKLVTGPAGTVGGDSGVAAPTNLTIEDTLIATSVAAMHLTWEPPADGHVTNGGKIEVQHRATTTGNNGTWISDGTVAGDARETNISGVVNAQTYDVRIRGVNVAGQTSAWLEVDAHTVSI